jgi:hypothetical protein
MALLIEPDPVVVISDTEGAGGQPDLRYLKLHRLCAEAAGIIP